LIYVVSGVSVSAKIHVTLVRRKASVIGRNGDNGGNGEKKSAECRVLSQVVSSSLR
jgi:hypothetical protein